MKWCLTLRSFDQFTCQFCVRAELGNRLSGIFLKVHSLGQGAIRIRPITKNLAPNIARTLLPVRRLCNLMQLTNTLFSIYSVLLCVVVYLLQQLLNRCLHFLQRGGLLKNVLTIDHPYGKMVMLYAW